MNPSPKPRLSRTLHEPRVLPQGAASARRTFVVLGAALVVLTLLWGGTSPLVSRLATLLIIGWMLLYGSGNEAGIGVTPRGSICRMALLGLACATLVPLPPTWLPQTSEPMLGLRWLSRCGVAPLGWHPLSYSPAATVAECLWLAACLSAYLLARSATWIELRSAMAWLTALLGLSAAEGLYGYFEWKQPEPDILGVPKIAYRGDLTGTFVNHNHLAGFLELALPFLLVYVLFVQHVWPLRLAALAWLGFLWAVLVATHSRSGLLSAAVVTCVLLYAGRRSARGWFPLLTAAFVLAGATFLVSHGRADALHWRALWTLSDGEVQDRWANWWAALQLIEAHPWLGTGLGSFAVAFRPLQVAAWGVFNHAHNDVVEIACEAGLPFAALLFGFLGRHTWRLIRTGSHPGHDLRAMLQLACGGALLGILLHSLTDFNLHIPANALALSVIAGIGAGLQRPPAAEFPAPRSQWRLHAGVGGLVLLALSTLWLVGREDVGRRVLASPAARLQAAPFDADAWSEFAGQTFSVAPRRAACAATRAALLGYRTTELNLRIAAVFALTGHTAPERAALRRVVQYDPERAGEAYRFATLQGASLQTLERDIAPASCAGARTLLSFLRDSGAPTAGLLSTARLEIQRCLPTPHAAPNLATSAVP